MPSDTATRVGGTEVPGSIRTEAREIFNEKASKLLVQALAAKTEPEIITAMLALRRVMAVQGLSYHEAKVFFAEGEAGQWMGSILRHLKRAEDDRDKAEAQTREYRDRMAVLEAGFRSVKRVLRDVRALNEKDFKLKMAVERAEGVR